MHVSRLLVVARQRRYVQAGSLLFVMLSLCIIGYIVQRQSHAAGTAISSEAESGQTSGTAVITNDPSASGGKAVTFGAPPTPLPAPAPAPTISYARKLIAPGIADPGVLKENNSLFFMSGTAPGNYLPIYKSTDLYAWNEIKRYDPNAVDGNYTYCFLWAPSFIKRNNLYYMYFTAQRVGKGQACPNSNVEPTEFFATAPDANMNFGTPQTINSGTQPRTYTPRGCPSDGCNHALRLDANVFFDGSRYWMHYNWFNPNYGNTISAFPLDNPAAVFQVSVPTGVAEEHVNEGPTIFARNGKYYLFYSQGNFQGNYAMRYIIGSNVGSLTSSLPIYRHSSPVLSGDGHKIETHGHNSIVERNGQYYNIFHVAHFDGAGNYSGRDTFVQPIMFKADGTIYTLNNVRLKWAPMTNATYSVDVQLRDGSVVAPCLIVGSATSYTYNDVCTAAGNRVVHKGDIAAFKVFYFVNNVLQKYLTVPYNGYEDDVTIQ